MMSKTISRSSRLKSHRSHPRTHENTEKVWMNQGKIRWHQHKLAILDKEHLPKEEWEFRKMSVFKLKHRLIIRVRWTEPATCHSPTKSSRLRLYPAMCTFSTTLSTEWAQLQTKSNLNLCYSDISAKAMVLTGAHFRLDCFSREVMIARSVSGMLTSRTNSLTRSIHWSR